MKACRFDPKGQLCECAGHGIPLDQKACCVYWREPDAPMPPPMEDEYHRRATSWQEACAMVAVMLLLAVATLGCLVYAASRSCP